MEIWKAGPDVMKMVKKLVAKHHPHLALIEDDIVILFREKAIERAGKVILGATKKAAALLSVLTDKEYTYKFIVEIGADVWKNELSDRQQMALLDHHLCSMKVEEDANSGEIRCSIRPPDIVAYREEIERWGIWQPLDEETLSIIEQMFGKKADERKGKVTKRSDATGGDVDDVIKALGGSN